MHTTSDIPFYLERKLIPIHITFILIFLFFPYTSWISYIFAILLSLSIYIELYRKKLQSKFKVTFSQEDQILFKEERSTFSMKIENRILMNDMSKVIQIRKPHSNAYSVTFDNENDTIFQLSELPDTLNFDIVGHQRGPFLLDDFAIMVKLPLGIGNIVVSVPPLLNWTVYPSIEVKNPRKIRTLFNLGDRATNHSPIKDRSQQISSHPYTIEPSRQIDWFATAKRGSLQAKIYQPSAQDTFTIMLDLSALNGPGLHHQYEELISQTALVSRELISEGGKIELFINKIDGTGRVTHLKIQEGAGHLKKILYVLSQLSERDVYVPHVRYNSYVNRVKNKQSQLVEIALP